MQVHSKRNARAHAIALHMQMHPSCKRPASAMRKDLQPPCNCTANAMQLECYTQMPRYPDTQKLHQMEKVPLVSVNRKLVPVEESLVPVGENWRTVEENLVPVGENWKAVGENRHRMRARYARATGTPPPACRFCGDPADAYPLPADGRLSEAHCPTCWYRHGRAIPLCPVPMNPSPLLPQGAIAHD